MLTKVCTIDDIPSIIAMYSEAKLSQNKHQPNEKFDVWTDPEQIERMISNPLVCITGTWEDDKMIASVTGTFWKGVPNWFLSSLITNKRTVNLNLRENGVASATELLIDYAESRGYYKFYTIVSERQYNSERAMTIFQKYIPKLQEYVYVTEAKIMPNELSDFDAFNNMLKLRIGETWQNNPVFIRSATALNSRRKF